MEDPKLKKIRADIDNADKLSFQDFSQSKKSHKSQKSRKENTTASETSKSQKTSQVQIQDKSEVSNSQVSSRESKRSTKKSSKKSTISVANLTKDELTRLCKEKVANIRKKKEKLKDLVGAIDKTEQNAKPIEENLHSYLEQTGNPGFKVEKLTKQQNLCLKKSKRTKLGRIKPRQVYRIIKDLWGEESLMEIVMEVEKLQEEKRKHREETIEIVPVTNTAKSMIILEEEGEEQQ